MKYNEFESMIIPFINVRGGNIVYPRESLSVAIENGIQDIYNEYRWSWLMNTKKVITTDWIDGNGYYLYDMGNIKAVLDFKTFDENGNLIMEYGVAAKLPDLTDSNYLVHGTYIITAQPLIASITYLDDYTWDLFNKDTTREIPLPDKMIPALYYLVLSQIDIIEVTQAESQTYSNYGKYTNKIKTLKENDLPIAMSIQGGNRF